MLVRLGCGVMRQHRCQDSDLLPQIADQGNIVSRGRQSA